MWSMCYPLLFPKNKKMLSFKPLTSPFISHLLGHLMLLQGEGEGGSLGLAKGLVPPSALVTELWLSLSWWVWSPGFSWAWLCASLYIVLIVFFFIFAYLIYLQSFIQSFSQYFMSPSHSVLSDPWAPPPGLPHGLQLSSCTSSLWIGYLFVGCMA